MVKEFKLNDVAMMKKKHACGCNLFNIIRTGADIKIKCQKCSKIIMLDRNDFIKSAKKIIET